jgi:hypothetical protein
MLAAFSRMRDQHREQDTEVVAISCRQRAREIAALL